MRRLLTLSLVLVAALSMSLGQYQVAKHHEAVGQAHNVMLEQLPPSYNSPNTTTDPIGTVTSSAVTAIKIGEADNAYTYILLNNNQVTTIPDIGTGGVVGFLYRQNIDRCSGNNGQYRVAFSEDAGSTWKVRPNQTVPPEPANPICWGIGPLNTDINTPTVTNPNIDGRRGRYPNFGLFTLSGSSDIDSLAGVFSGPVLRSGQTNSGWDGYVTGVTIGLNGPTPTTTDEVLHYQDDGSGNFTQYFCLSMVQQHPDSNIWYFLSRDFNPNGGDAGDGAAGRQLILNRGVYDNATRRMTWTTTHTWTFNLFTISTPDNDVPNGFAPLSPAIAFAPDGQVGYIAFLSDLENQGTDTTLAPILIETLDGGRTWGSPFEIDLHAFPELMAIIQEDTFWTDASQTTVLWYEPKVTTAFDFDLEVDKNGNPHIFTAISANQRRSDSPDPDLTDNEPNFGSIYSGYYMTHYDITRDTYGDWNMIEVSPQNALRGYFGDISNFTEASEYFSMDYHSQVGRTAEGDVIFFSWADTDTAANPTIDGPNDPNLGQTRMSNYRPNLHTFALNVDDLTSTSVVNWTENDNVWSQAAIMPRLANVVLEDGADYIMPITVISVDNGDAIEPVSFYYFNDVMYNEADFVNPVEFFYNCKENPITSVLTSSDATCGNADGSASIAVSGGILPYTYEWDDPMGSTTNAANNLPANIYQAVVTDSIGCTDITMVTINDQGAPSLAIADEDDPTCFTTVNGTARVVPTGGTAPLSYSWDTSGESDSIATQLPGGTSVVIVTDANGCESRITVMLTTPPEISLNISGTDVRCAGADNGNVSVLATGGTGMLTYEWNGDNTLTTPSLGNVGPGAYNVVVTDANGCTSNTSLTISEPDPLEITALSVSPRRLAWRIEATVDGGTTPYQYLWTSLTDPGLSIDSSQSVRDLEDGCYQLRIVDANGCNTIDTAAAGTFTMEMCRNIMIDNIEGELTAGIEAFTVYPNPANQTVYIALTFDRTEDVRAELLDVTGKVMRSNMLSGRDMNVRMDVDNLSTGVYLVRVSTSRGSAVRKLMVR
jgi:hypothetical protein